MRDLTGQEVMEIAVEKIGHGNAAEAVRVARLRELRPDVDALGEQVRRWARGEHDPPSDVVLRMLEVLEAIDWDKLGDRVKPS